MNKTELIKNIVAILKVKGPAPKKQAKLSAKAQKVRDYIKERFGCYRTQVEELMEILLEEKFPVAEQHSKEHIHRFATINNDEWEEMNNATIIITGCIGEKLSFVELGCVSESIDCGYEDPIGSFIFPTTKKAFDANCKQLNKLSQADLTLILKELL
jgi:hypothetical protein